MRTVDKQVFKSGQKEKVPSYLKQFNPPKEGEPCREYLAKQTKWGERPPAEAFMKIANQLYIEHCLKNEKVMAKQLAKKKAATIRSSRLGRRH